MEIVVLVSGAQSAVGNWFGENGIKILIEVKTWRKFDKCLIGWLLKF
jgi:hypothetical protein